MKNEIIKEIEGFVNNADENGIKMLVLHLEGTGCSKETVDALEKLAHSFSRISS